MQEEQLPYDLQQKLIFSDGNKLKIAREHRGISIDELSAISGISMEQLNFLENNKIELLGIDLCKIASLLQIDEELLIDNAMLLSRQENMLFNQIVNQISSPKEKMILSDRLLRWLSIILYHRRQKWQQHRQNSVEVLYSLQKQADARKRGQIRDKKYAPFREYFKNMQQQKYLEYQKSGRQLTANGFAIWFLRNLPTHIAIPYRQSNLKNKLIQLAQANNREFKKAFEC